jgi:hypothetical protein
MRKVSHQSTHERTEAIKAAMAITEENPRSINISMQSLLALSC